MLFGEGRIHVSSIGSVLLLTSQYTISNESKKERMQLIGSLRLLLAAEHGIPFLL
jgi:hypothetical protein